MAGDEVSGTRRRRRRRAVWRPGEGISRIVDAASGEPVDELGGFEAAGVAATGAIADIEHGSPDIEDGSAAAEPAPGEAPVAVPGPSAARRTARRSRIDPAERSLRDLVGAGPSQLGPVRAMQARDANRPTDADIAEAEQNLTIVRRNWKPPAE